MNKLNVFEFRDYRAYTNAILKERSHFKKGQRSRLSEAMGCRPAFLSQVLSGSKELSPEQAQVASEFLGHSPIEAKYFLRLVLWARAGTPALRKTYDEDIKSLKENYSALRGRIKVEKELSDKEQAQHYSSWFYAAIHTCLLLPKVRSREAIADALGLPLTTVSTVLEFLESVGLASRSGNQYKPTENNVFIGKESTFITQHHRNWLMRAIQSLDSVQENDLHYSTVISCSAADAVKVREILMQAVAKVRETVKSSTPDEVLYSYTINLFELFGKH